MILPRFSGFRITEIKTLPFFGLLFLFQLLTIFQGVDACDGGSYACFYQQIFTNPESVQYSFMFWLSGVIGGLYLKLFPLLGILGLRLFGVIVCTSTIAVAYNLLKQHINKGRLQLSLIVLLLFMNNNPKEIYYNNLSALIYVMAIYSLFIGLRKEKLFLVFVSGFLVAANIFNRIPNVLAIGLLSAVFYCGYLYKTKFKKQLTQSFVFLTGVFFGTLIVLLAMKQLGHLNWFENSLKILFSMGKASKQVDGIDSNYGLINLIKALYGQYKLSIISSILIFEFIIFGIPLVGQIRNKLPYKLVKFILSRYILIIIVVLLIYFRIINQISIIYVINGICVSAACLILIINKNREISLLMFLGIFIAIVHPMGSSTGIHTVIIYSLWIAFPIAMDSIWSVKSTYIQLNFPARISNYTLSLALSEEELKIIKKTGIGLLIFACFFYTLNYPYFDRHSRLKMHYAIQNKYMQGIFTSDDRARAINELLKASSKYVKPNDYVLAYDCFPLYHYMTETRPYTRNPWPWLYMPDIFKNELTRSQSEITYNPVIIFQRIRTMGPNGGKWPDSSTNETTLNWDLNQSRNKILKDFITINRYKIVWSNNVFDILVPEKVVTAEIR